MPPLFLFQTQRFFSSVNTSLPAASSSPMWRQSMQTNAIAPSQLDPAECPSVCRRNCVNASDDISPAPIANSRCRIRPNPQYIAVNGNVIGRIGEDQAGTLALQDLLKTLE